MIYLGCCAVAFAACILGTICGMGGGIIIKPVLDATGVMSVAAVNFLSGCTVIAMSCWRVGKTALKKESALDMHSTPFWRWAQHWEAWPESSCFIWLPHSLPIKIRRAACRRVCCFSRPLQRCSIP